MSIYRNTKKRLDRQASLGIFETMKPRRRYCRFSETGACRTMDGRTMFQIALTCRELHSRLHERLRLTDSAFTVGLSNRCKSRQRHQDCILHALQLVFQEADISYSQKEWDWQIVHSVGLSIHSGCFKIVQLFVNLTFWSCNWFNFSST